jgi:AdoMet-dependent heme synthase
MNSGPANFSCEICTARAARSGVSAERRAFHFPDGGTRPRRRYDAEFDLVVVWRITQRCNLGCPFCAYDRRLARARRDAEPAEVLRFGAVLAEHQRATGQSVLVSWIGGEPLLWRPLGELTTEFTRTFGLAVSTTTNGTTLGAPEVRRHLLEHYAELTVSVDGIGAVHDRLRGWPGGFASLRRNVSALASEKRMAGGGPRLRANVVLMRDTVAGFERLCGELADWGIEEITFNQLGGNDRPEFFPAHRFLPEQVDGLAAELPGLRARLAAAGVQLDGGDGYLRRIHASARGKKLPVDDCHPGSHFLFISERGITAPCSFTAQGCGVPLREVDSAEALLQLPGRFGEARRRTCPTACEDCLSTQVFEKFTD